MWGYADRCERDGGLCIHLALKPGQSQSLTSHTDSNASYTKMFGQNQPNGPRRKGEKHPGLCRLAWVSDAQKGTPWSQATPAASSAAFTARQPRTRGLGKARCRQASWYFCTGNFQRRRLSQSRLLGKAGLESLCWRGTSQELYRDDAIATLL